MSHLCNSEWVLVDFSFAKLEEEFVSSFICREPGSLDSLCEFSKIGYYNSARVWLLCALLNSTEKEAQI
jgi:hypothetical protein